jgi:predicted transcriptional regulator
MKEERIKILKVMSEATSRMDMTTFEEKVNLSANEIIDNIEELANVGLLRKVGRGYGVTEKGKTALKAFNPVPNEMAFHFYVRIGQPTGFLAQTLEEFYRFVEQVNGESLEFHLYRGDFENWLKDAIKDAELAEEIGKIKNANLKGEDLRKEILNAVEAKYSIEALL